MAQVAFDFAFIMSGENFVAFACPANIFLGFKRQKLVVLLTTAEDFLAASLRKLS
jgi:hypothetical protein